MATNLIVARMAPESAGTVARIFADSDGTELPHLVGVRRRQLFAYQGLYFHLFETSDEGAGRLDDVREHPLFTDVNTRLLPHITAYDPDTWRSPKDAMAARFYEWTPAGGAVPAVAVTAAGEVQRS